jgi:hypothetical protein
MRASRHALPPSLCERICERNAARRPRWRGVRRDDLDGRLVVTYTFETCGLLRDADRLAHNPEVAGSNPVPATSVPATSRRPLENAPGAVFVAFANVRAAGRLTSQSSGATMSGANTLDRDAQDAACAGRRAPQPAAAADRAHRTSGPERFTHEAVIAERPPQPGLAPLAPTSTPTASSSEQRQARRAPRRRRYRSTNRTALLSAKALR